MKPSLAIIEPDELERYAKIGLDRAEWYDRALAEIIRVCVAEKWDIVDFAHKIAILSPQVAIRRNIRMALEFQHNGHHMTNTVKNIRRSMEIYEQTGKILGKKTRSFANALLGDSQAIVLDTRMSKVILPEEFITDSNSFKRVATRRNAESVVRIVARRLRLSPRDCQAAIWSGVFREFGNQPQWFPVAEEYDRWLAYDREFPISGYVPNK